MSKERMIEEFVFKVWPKGLTHERMADELERIAGLVRDGNYAGDGGDEKNSGWWDTTEVGSKS